MKNGVRLGGRREPPVVDIVLHNGFSQGDDDSDLPNLGQQAQAAFREVLSSPVPGILNVACDVIIFTLLAKASQNPSPWKERRSEAHV